MFILQIAAIAFLPPAAAFTSPPPACTPYLYGPQRPAGKPDTDRVPEASGVVPSHRQPGLYWTHNDSDPAGPRVYAFHLKGHDQVAYRGSVELRGANTGDWEDIAAGSNAMIYILDGGDNPPCTRSAKHIYRFREPAMPSQRFSRVRRVPCESIRFEYPDRTNPKTPASQPRDRFDAEALWVHPITGDIYLVTKRDTHNRPVARVYKIRASQWTSDRGSPTVLQFVADLSDRVPHMVTAADISADGRCMILRNYWAMYQFRLPNRRPFDAIFQQTPTKHMLWREAAGVLQGEGICWAHDGCDVVTVAEARPYGRDRAFNVFVVPWRLANVNVKITGPTSAVFSWRTAQPAPSKVELRSEMGQTITETDTASTTDHRLALANLKPGTRYHYRLSAGPIRWPALEPWATFTISKAAQHSLQSKTAVSPD
jgi:hypothetical protein